MVSQIAFIGTLLCLLGQASAFFGTAVRQPSHYLTTSTTSPTSSSSSLWISDPGDFRKSVSEQTQANNYLRKTAGVLPEPDNKDNDSISAQVQEQNQLPPLDPAWIEAARQPCAWDAASVTENNDESANKDIENISSWQNGQRWFVTREALLDLWVLPRDISKGSWENYANAATKAEEIMLNQVPQLLRLEPSAVVESARMVLNDLQLPPALLRREPILLTMDSERLRGAFESIRLRISSSRSDLTATSEDTTEDVTTVTIGVAANTPGLLVKVATKWTKVVAEDGSTSADKKPEQGNKADNLKLLQKSFDNELFASDLHMESFLDS